MQQIEELYGVEVIVHIKAMGDNRTPGGVLLPTKLPDWIEATVIAVGTDCKKGLSKGDIVIIDKNTYNESPNLTKSQFEFPKMDVGEFKILTEYRIVMKIKPQLNLEFVPGVDNTIQRKDL